MTQTQQPRLQSDDAALKAKHAAMWAMGDYPAVATEVIAALGPALVAATGIGPGDHVLDIAAGSGNASIPAAQAGADVVASDLTPDLIETGRQAASRAGVAAALGGGRRRGLPYADAEFDAAISCVGIMFAPHHQAAADELVRVVRPGGRIGLLSWTPAGFIGQMFATMKPFAPPPPPGAQPPPLWGDEAHVRELLGDRVTDVDGGDQDHAGAVFPDGASFRDFFKRTYGPTIAVYRFLADDPARTAELDEALAAHGDRYVGDGPMEWEYLLFSAGPESGALGEVRRREGEAVRDVLPRADVDVVGGALERGVVGAVGPVAGAHVTGLLDSGLGVALHEGAAGRDPWPSTVIAAAWQSWSWL